MKQELKLDKLDLKFDKQDFKLDKSKPDKMKNNYLNESYNPNDYNNFAKIAAPVEVRSLSIWKLKINLDIFRIQCTLHIYHNCLHPFLYLMTAHTVNPLNTTDHLHNMVVDSTEHRNIVKHMVIKAI